MDLTEFLNLEFLQTFTALITGAVAAVGLYWTIAKIISRKEHHARIAFNITANVIDIHKKHAVVSIDTSLDNKGHVPLTIPKLLIKVYGFHSDDSFHANKDEKKGLNFSHKIHDSSMLPSTWNFTFVEPNVMQKYHRVIAVPIEMRCILIIGKFYYDWSMHTPHTTATVIKIELPKDKE